MKVAIVHYWLVGMRDGEKVVEAILESFPEADIFTHVVDHSQISDQLSQQVRGTSFINRLPFAKRLYPYYLPLMPLALEQLDLSGYDLIISSESGPAKGVISDPTALHICYCHTPMRYAWDMQHESTKNSGTVKRLIMAWLLHRIRLWDLASSFRVDHFIANSSFVQKRIEKYYRRPATVIHPPVDTQEFHTSPTQDDFYLMVGQLVPYKNTEQAIKAFNENGKELRIIGAGEELKRLLRLAKGNIKMLGHQSFEDSKENMAKCQALSFPGVEDFGIVPVEVMASGRPIIGLRKGGLLDSLEEGVTGLFFDEPTVESLNDAIQRFEASKDSFNTLIIKRRADKFDKAVFTKRFSEFLKDKLSHRS